MATSPAVAEGSPILSPICACGLVTAVYADILYSLFTCAEAPTNADEILQQRIRQISSFHHILQEAGIMWNTVRAMAGEWTVLAPVIGADHGRRSPGGIDRVDGGGCREPSTFRATLVACPGFSGHSITRTWWQSAKTGFIPTTELQASDDQSLRGTVCQLDVLGYPVM